MLKFHDCLLGTFKGVGKMSFSLHQCCEILRAYELLCKIRCWKYIEDVKKSNGIKSEIALTGAL